MATKTLRAVMKWEVKTGERRGYYVACTPERGGGDYRGNDDRVGSWARDSISMEREAPEGYELVDGGFSE